MTQKLSSEEMASNPERNELEQQRATAQQLKWQEGLREWIDPQLRQRDAGACYAADWRVAENELANELRPVMNVSGSPRHIRTGMATKVIAVLNSFLRLNPSTIDSFKRTNPRFFPPEFWDRSFDLDFTKPANGANPNFAAQPVLAMDMPDPRKVELQKYGLGVHGPDTMQADFERLKSFPLWAVWKHALRRGWEIGIDIQELLWLPWSCLPEGYRRSPIPQLRLGERKFRFAPEWEFQDAVLGLAFQSWRAHFCSHCGEPYVAATRQSKYCNPECQAAETEAANLDRKRRYYNKNRSSINGKRRKKYRESKRTRRLQRLT